MPHTDGGRERVEVGARCRDIARPKGLELDARCREIGTEGLRGGSVREDEPSPGPAPRQLLAAFDNPVDPGTMVVKPRAVPVKARSDLNVRYCILSDSCGCYGAPRLFRADVDAEDGSLCKRARR